MVVATAQPPPVFLLTPEGPGHALDAGDTARCGKDLSGAERTTATACHVYGVPLCLACFPAGSGL